VQHKSKNNPTLLNANDLLDENEYIFSDLSKYTDMKMSTVTQRQSVFYSGSFPLLRFVIAQLAADVQMIEDRDVSDKKVNELHNKIFAII